MWKKKHDVFSRKVSNAQEKVRGMLKAEFMKWIFRFAIIKLKAGFHMIANDRRRSQRDLFPYNRRRSQTIAQPTVAIHFVQRKCHMYSRVVLAGKSKQTTWRTSRRKFWTKVLRSYGNQPLRLVSIWSQTIADRRKFCDRLRSYGNTLLRSSAIICDPAIIWKPKFCDLRSKCIP